MGVFTNALRGAAVECRAGGEAGIRKGLGTWLINRLGHRAAGTPTLKVLERITVTPRQALLLLEVEGQRVLMATSDAGAPAFYEVKRCSAISSPRGPAAIRIEGTCA